MLTNISAKSKLLGLACAFLVAFVACTQDPSADSAEGSSQSADTTGVRLSPAAKAALAQVGIVSLNEDLLRRLDTDRSNTVSVEEITVWLDTLRSSQCGGTSTSSSGGSSSGSSGSSSGNTSSGGSSCVES
jgi:uncharacterized membrane protein YgcG